MFENTRGTVGGRRAGRIAFGSVLIAGVLGMGMNVMDEARMQQLGLHTAVSLAAVIVGTWVLALLVGGAVSRARIEDSTHLRSPSLVIPSIGVALMGPLLLHMPFVAGSGDESVRWWVGLSILAVGIAHVVLAALMGLRAWKLMEGKKPISVGAVYGYTVLASIVPLGMFIVPEFLVALTGLPFIALLYAQQWIARRDLEAEQLAELPEIATARLVVA